MKVIVDIKNKTLKMLENERSIFKGEYSADKLELYINQQLENEYPVITGLLSNGRRIGPYTTDSSYGIEQIDGMTYTTAEFTLSKENGFTLSEGVMQITIWIYTTKDSEVVSKIAIGNITFNVVNTTSFNDGDIIISGDVEGAVVNLKVEVENLQQVLQINNVAINNLQNNKADKTTLNDYLKRDGSKPMTGDLDMDGNDITNTRLYDKETHNYIALSGLDNGALLFSSKSGALELRSPKMDDFDTSNFLIYPIPENTNHIAGQEYETYEWNLPKESGTIALDKDIPTKTSQLTNDSNYATTNQLFSKNYNDLTNKPSIPSSTNQLTNNSGFITNTVNNLTNYYLKSEIYTKSEVQQLLGTISSLNLKVVTNLPTTNISTSTIYLKPLDSAKENNIYEEYIYINNKWETIGTTAVDLSNYALKTDVPTKLSQLEQDVELGVSEEDVMEIVEKNAEQTDTLDVGTSATFNPESDKQIPTSKAVSNLMASAGGSGKMYEHNILVDVISGIDGSGNNNHPTRDLYFKITNTSNRAFTVDDFLTYFSNWLNNNTPFQSNYFYFSNGVLNNNYYGNYNIQIFIQSLLYANTPEIESFSISSGNTFQNTDNTKIGYINKVNDNVIEL